MSEWRGRTSANQDLKLNTRQTNQHETAQAVETTEHASSGDQGREKNKRGCGCCLAKLFALLLMLVMIGFIAAFIWRLVTHNRLQDRLADYGAEGEVYGAQHLNEVYSAEENAAQSTAHLAAACDDLSSENFEQQCGHLPYVGEGTIPEINQEWAELEDAQNLVNQYQRAVDQLHQFGALDGHAHFPIDFSKRTGLDAESVRMMNRGFNFLRLDCEVQMRENNSERLADSLCTLLVYSNAVSDIPSTDQYLRVDYDDRALRMLRKGLKSIHFELEDLNRFYELLLVDRDYREGLRKMLMGAKVVGNQFFVDPSGYFEMQLASKSPDELPDVLKNQRQVERHLKYSPTAHEDHLAFLEAIEPYMDIPDLPWDEIPGRFAELARQNEEKFSGNWAARRYPYTPQLLSDYSDYGKQIEVIRIHRQMLQGALIVKRYEAGEKKMPLPLHDVVPKYSDQPPQDPYSDTVLIYQYTDDYFSLHSVGPNGQDDFGSNRGEADDIRIVLPRNKFDGERPVNEAKID